MIDLNDDLRLLDAYYFWYVKQINIPFIQLLFLNGF